MKYSEVFTDNGLFARFKALQPAIYTSLFNDTTPAVLDQQAQIIAANKTLIDAMTDQTADVILNSVLFNLATVWDKAKAALNIDYDVLSARRTKETTSGNDTTDIVSNNSDTESIKAFDSTAFIDNQKNARTGDTNNARTYQSTKTVDNGQTDAQTAIEREITFRAKMTLFKIVLADILSEITLSIYE